MEHMNYEITELRSRLAFLDTREVDRENQKKEDGPPRTAATYPDECGPPLHRGCLYFTQPKTKFKRRDLTARERRVLLWHFLPFRKTREAQRTQREIRRIETYERTKTNGTMSLDQKEWA